MKKGGVWGRGVDLNYSK